MPNVSASPDYTDEGRLLVRVNSPSIANPVPNATVRILAPDSGKVLEELITDSSGKTMEIILGAPPIEYSMGLGDRKPYGLYDIQVTAQDFSTNIIRNVQILPDSTALQQADLMPGAAGSESDILIPDHTLWGSFPVKKWEEDIKPLPNPGGYVVLPEPVIPEYIVVHAGVPTDTSAPNHWVPFKDYIKNVSSCEIYSNWPEQTLIANVLAIISFTLNRVYTEKRPLR